MFHLLHIEFKKLFKYKTFWILTGLFFLLTALVFFGIQGFIDEVTSDTNQRSPIPIPSMSIYNFPDIWHNITFLAGYLKTILGIIFIILMTNEYHFKTVRHNIINGLSRMDYLKGKTMLMLTLSFALAVIILVVGLILGIQSTPNLTFAVALEKMLFVAGYLFETIAYLVLVMFIAILLRRAGLAIGLLLLYTYIIEPILAYKLPDAVVPYLPLQAIGNIIQVPNTQLMRLFGVEFGEGMSVTAIFITLGWMIIFAFSSIMLMKKKDL